MGLFSKLFNAKSIGYHSDAISRMKVLDDGSTHEELRHFTIIPDNTGTFCIQEISDMNFIREVGSQLALSEAITRMDQLVALRIQSLRTTAENPEAVSLIEGMPPVDENFVWLHASTAAAAA